MNLTEKARLIVAFSEEHISKEDYEEFFDYNDLGVPLAISLMKGYINLRDAGEVVIAETWSDLCTVVNADPSGHYTNLDELTAAGKNALPRIDIQRSIELNNQGHQAFKSGDAGTALNYWKQASDMGQPNAITSLVWLNIMLNKFDQLDSILFDQPDSAIPGYGGRTENWRAQYDALAGDPNIGASQFDSQKVAIFYNSALCAWLSGDENRALAFLVLAGDGAEPEFLQSTIGSVPVSEMELDEVQVAELIGIYERAIEDFERIKSFDSSLIELWEGKTLAKFAAENIVMLREFQPIGITDTFVSHDPAAINVAVETDDIARPTFGEFAERMQNAVDGNHEGIREIAQLGMRIFSQHEELEDHEEDGWDMDSLWFDVVEDGISQILSEPGALENSELMDAILLFSEHDSHLLCLLLAEDVDRDVVDQSILQRISNSQPCGHDTGRIESCIGWQIRLAMHPNTPGEVLTELHDDTNHTDQNSVRWALAMNPSTPNELLSMYAGSSGSGWRIIGEIEEYGVSGVSVSEVDSQIQSFIRWAVAGNPSLGPVDRNALAEILVQDLQEINFEDLDNLALEIRRRAVSSTPVS